MTPRFNQIASGQPIPESHRADANVCLPVDHSEDLRYKMPEASLATCQNLHIGQTVLHASTYVIPSGNTAYLAETAESPRASIHGIRLVNFLGLTERVDLPFSYLRGDGLMSAGIADRSITIGHNGIGIPGMKDGQSREDAGIARLALLNYTANEDEALITVETSMGSVLGTDILAANLNAGSPLKIAGRVLFAPAVRRNGGVDPVFAADFARQMLADASRELFASGPIDRIRRLGQFASWGQESFRHLGHNVHQAAHILGSTSIEDVRQLSALYPTIVIAGEKDKVYDAELWDQMESEFPGTVRVVRIPRRGHEIVLYPDKAVIKIIKETLGFPRFKYALAS